MATKSTVHAKFNCPYYPNIRDAQEEHRERKTSRRGQKISMRTSCFAVGFVNATNGWTPSETRSISLSPMHHKIIHSRRTGEKPKLLKALKATAALSFYVRMGDLASVHPTMNAHKNFCKNISQKHKISRNDAIFNNREESFNWTTLGKVTYSRGSYTEQSAGNRQG